MKFLINKNIENNFKNCFYEQKQKTNLIEKIF